MSFGYGLFGDYRSPTTFLQRQQNVHDKNSVKLIERTADIPLSEKVKHLQYPCKLVLSTRIRQTHNYFLNFTI